MMPDAATFTLLPKGTGIFGTPAFVFEIAEGIWCIGDFGTKTKPAVTVALGTQLVAAVHRVQLGFMRRHGRQCAVMPTPECAFSSPLNRDEAWRRVMFLPLADPASSTSRSRSSRRRARACSSSGN
jgi:hypothetical protein